MDDIGGFPRKPHVGVFTVVLWVCMRVCVYVVQRIQFTMRFKDEAKFGN